MRILFVGGLSAGHLSPLLAVEEEMKKKGNLESLFVCSKRESDAAFLRANGAEFVQITHARRSVSCVWQFPQGFMEGWKLLRSSSRMLSLVKEEP
jgi:UDP-N-acetylglucosamine:LPS N-acetylglucosamine transferase